MNQNNFAREIQISQASLSDIEKGKSKPSVDTLFNISEQFGISADWIIKGDRRLTEQYLGSEIIQEIFNIIPEQISQNKAELMNKFNIDKQLINSIYNLFFLKLILTALTADEKSFLEILSSSKPELRKEYLSILNSLHFNEDVKDIIENKNKASS